MSHHNADNWRSQYDRMTRWFDRLRVVLREDVLTDSELDFVYAFFINCYHLRDWLNKTPNSRFSQKSIEDLFSKDEASEALKLCHDIATGLKHLTLSRPKIDANFAVVREYVAGGGEKWLILADGKKWPIEDLAIDCMSAWDEFIRNAPIDRRTTSERERPR